MSDNGGMTSRTFSHANNPRFDCAPSVLLLPQSDFRNPSAVEFVSLDMEYFDALRYSGWIDDPSDTVRVITVHADDCATTQGEACSCTPRLTLVPDAPRADRREERDLPWRDLASGE